MNDPRFAVFCVFAGFVIACAGACSASHPATSGALDAGAGAADGVVRIPVTVEAESGAITFQSEIADTPEETMRGLMFRTALGEREGMIFLFPREQPLRFWMKNTLIPLDLVFIKADHTILGVVENAEPKTETGRMVPGYSQFVLEVIGGTAAKLGIKAGQTVNFYAPLPSQ